MRKSDTRTAEQKERDEYVMIAGRYPQNMYNGECRVYHWRRPDIDDERRCADPIVEFVVVEELSVLAIHRGKALTLDEVLAYEDFEERPPDEKTGGRGWDLIIWQNKKVAAVVEKLDDNGEGCRVTRMEGYRGVKEKACSTEGSSSTRSVSPSRRRGTSSPAATSRPSRTPASS